MTPISRRRGPRMKPPPEPSSPPTVPPNTPQRAQKARFVAVQSMAASHMDSWSPASFLFLLSMYSFVPSYPNAPSAIGNYTEPKQTTSKHFSVASI